MIKTYIDSKFYLHFYTFHLLENGVIGKEYTDERYIVQDYKEDISNISYLDSVSGGDRLGAIVFSNTNPLAFFGVRTYIDSRYDSYLYARYATLTPTLDETNNKVSLNIFFANETKVSTNTAGYYNASRIRISDDDKFITISRAWAGGGRTYYGTFLELSDRLYPKVKSHRNTTDQGYILIALEEYDQIISLSRK